MANAIDDQWLCTYKGTLDGQLMLSTFLYRNTVNDPAFPAEVDAAIKINAALTAGGNIQGKLLACLPANYTLDALWVQKIRPVRYRRTTFIKNLPGTSANNSDAPNLAQAVTRQSTLANRHTTGTLHLPVPTGPGSILSGNLTGVQLIVLNVLAAQMPAILAPAGSIFQFTPILFNRTVGGPVYTVDTAAGQITVRTMHRRTVGLGK